MTYLSQAQQQQVRRETSEEDSTMMSEWRQTCGLVWTDNARAEFLSQSTPGWKSNPCPTRQPASPSGLCWSNTARQSSGRNCDSEGSYQKSGSCLEPVRDVRFIDRLREEQKNAKPSDQFLNTLRFIGELFLSKVLTEKAMHCCIRRLLLKGDGPSLEGLCELLQLIQQDLEVVTSKEVMDIYYNQLDFIAEKGKRAPRLSLLLKHTVDSRK
ncbi:unnamed protein product [Pleuronectes platessa]|uniref:MIF4G domain-containing protein n=1 Tax=Pleuronectes platessa TaxID=8262 RepID=A0A9N7VBZ9_PLEPL|nr:unnamed protein product [Pleuronectes platessa]